MSVPNWLRQREDQERVEPSALLMELPEISVQEWEESAAQYLVQAGQIAFYLRQQSTEVELLLDRADREVDQGNFASAKVILAGAMEQLGEVPPLQSLHACVRAGLLSDRLGDDELRSRIMPSCTVSLRNAGLEDVAFALEQHRTVAGTLGAQTAKIFGMGILSRVNTWSLAATWYSSHDDRPA